MLKKKELEIILQNLDSHPDPSPELEQYMTPGDVAASLLNLAYVNGSIKEKSVCDLGCGTGRLAIGASLLGATKVMGVDVDAKALEVASKNACRSEVDVEWMESDVRDFQGSGFDTVIQNPPFGVQKKGADIIFLKKALSLGREIYSVHKGSRQNRDFITKRVKELNGKITHIMEKKFQIPALFKFHSRDMYRITVDIYKIVRR